MVRGNDRNDELPDDMGAFADTADCVEERDFETESVD
jgi:hypothetical protein